MMIEPKIIIESGTLSPLLSARQVFAFKPFQNASALISLPFAGFTLLTDSTDASAQRT